MSIFKKDDIKAGYLLRVKDIESGDEFNMTVVPTCARTSRPFGKLLGVKPYEEGTLACCCPDEHWWGLPDFDDELVCDGIRRYQVIAVYGYAPPKFLMDNSTEDRDLLWSREKQEEKKLFPLEDIEAGYLLKIKDDDGSTYNMTVIPNDDGELGCDCPQEGRYWPLSRFGKKLRYDESAIVAVYSGTCNRLLLANTTEDRVQLWSRE